MSTANKLHEACVFTRPDTFEANTLLHVCRTFYDRIWPWLTLQELQRKALKKQEQLTTQMGWAQSEAERSRRVADSVPRSEQTSLATQEESALEMLFKSHGALTESLKEYDDLSERCVEERQMREVQERSKKDTRMDRRQQMDMLAAPGEGMATTSRSPSPSRNYMPLPPENGRSPRTTDSGHGHSSQSGHVENLTSHMAGINLEPKRSRSPSPTSHGLSAPPKIGRGQSPPRSRSPQGRTRVPGPRPLPNPNAQFKPVSSNPNLVATATEHDSRAPTRGGSGSSIEGGVATSNGSAVIDEDGEGAPARPSRKALGKRRAVPDEDSECHRTLRLAKLGLTSQTTLTPMSCSRALRQRNLTPTATRTRSPPTKCTCPSRSRTRTTRGLRRCSARRRRRLPRVPLLCPLSARPRPLR